MTLSPDEAQALLRDGMAALRAGQPQQAHSLFSRAVAMPSGAPGYYMLAQACRLLGDLEGERDALDRHLRREPRHLAALLLMAEYQVRVDDDRAASSFYRTAFAVAGQQSSQISPTIEAMLRRGEAFVAAANQRFTDHLETVIGSAEIGIGGDGRRVRQSIDLLLGRTQLYLQQPSMFYFPGLPQRQYYEREEFAWIAEVEAATPAIKRELQALIADGRDFHPYVEHNGDRPAPANHLLDDPSWGAFDIWRAGSLVADNAARCPATVAALSKVPAPVIAGRSPMAIFSRLKPGTHIRPHNGLINTRLICHLPIIAPPDCAFRVGNETRPWREGEMLIFDDSIEHEAWNRSHEDRIVLLFEIWRPEITETERGALVPIFEAIGSYDGEA